MRDKISKIVTCCMTAVLLVALLPVQQVQAASKVEGFDVSSKNGVIDWETVAEADMDFVMLRTGEGQAPDVDVQFEANYEGAKAAGLKVGAYHVCCVRTPEAAAKEAEYCLEILGGRELDYPLAYDIEKAGCFADGKSNTTAIAKAFCEVIADEMKIEHIAFSVGSKERVDELTAQMKQDGYEVISGPRTTGDGYYESCIIGVEGNQIEITI